MARGAPFALFTLITACGSGSDSAAENGVSGAESAPSGSLITSDSLAGASELSTSSGLDQTIGSGATTIHGSTTHATTTMGDLTWSDTAENGVDGTTGSDGEHDVIRVLISPTGIDHTTIQGLRIVAPVGSVTEPTQLDLHLLSEEEFTALGLGEIVEHIGFALATLPRGLQFAKPVEIFVPNELFIRPVEPGLESFGVNFDGTRGSVEQEVQLVSQSELGVTIAVHGLPGANRSNSPGGSDWSGIGALLKKAKAVQGEGSRFDAVFVCPMLARTVDNLRVHCPTLASNPKCCEYVETMEDWFSRGVKFATELNFLPAIDQVLYNEWRSGLGAKFRYSIDRARMDLGPRWVDEETLLTTPDLRRWIELRRLEQLEDARRNWCCDPDQGVIATETSRQQLEFDTNVSRNFNVSTLELLPSALDCSGRHLDELRAVEARQAEFEIYDYMDFDKHSFRTRCPKVFDVKQGAGTWDEYMDLYDEHFRWFRECRDSHSNRGTDFDLRVDLTWKNNEQHEIEVDGRLVPGESGCECTRDLNGVELEYYRPADGEPPQACRCPNDFKDEPTTWDTIERACKCHDGGFPVNQSSSGRVSCCPSGSERERDPVTGMVLVHGDCLCNDGVTVAIDADEDGLSDNCADDETTDGASSEHSGDADDGAETETTGTLDEFQIELSAMGPGKFEVETDNDGMGVVVEEYVSILPAGTFVSVQERPAKGSHFERWLERSPSGSAMVSKNPSGPLTMSRSMIGEFAPCPTGSHYHAAEHACLCPDGTVALDEDDDGTADNGCCPEGTSPYDPPGGQRECKTHTYRLRGKVSGISCISNIHFELVYDGERYVANPEGEGDEPCRIEFPIWPAPGEHEVELTYIQLGPARMYNMLFSIDPLWGNVPDVDFLIEGTPEPRDSVNKEWKTPDAKDVPYVGTLRFTAIY